MTDLEKMNVALSEAKKSLRKKQIPVGVAIFYKDKLLVKSHNKKIKRKIFNHAEMIALSKLKRKYTNLKYVNDLELYVTMEPCLMCYGAIKDFRIKKLFFSIYNNNVGFSKYVEIEKDIFIKSGLLSEESKKLLSSFFKEKR